MAAAATTDRWRGGLVVLALLGTLTACGGSEDNSADPPSPSPTAMPAEPSQYMNLARNLWSTQHQWEQHPDPQVLHIAPVKADGTTWTGDPKTYEQACGTHFVFEDDTLKSYDGYAPGGDISDVQGAEKHTYYDWLRSDPKRWGAFNAWLLDPAIVKAADPSDPTGADLVSKGEVGGTSGCPDAAAKVAALLR